MIVVLHTEALAQKAIAKPMNVPNSVQTPSHSNIESHLRRQRKRQQQKVSRPYGRTRNQINPKPRRAAKGAHLGSPEDKCVSPSVPNTMLNTIPTYGATTEAMNMCARKVRIVGYYFDNVVLRRRKLAKRSTRCEFTPVRKSDGMPTFCTRTAGAFPRPRLSVRERSCGDSSTGSDPIFRPARGIPAVMRCATENRRSCGW